MSVNRGYRCLDNCFPYTLGFMVRAGIVLSLALGGPRYLLAQEADGTATAPIDPVAVKAAKKYMTLEVMDVAIEKMKESEAHYRDYESMFRDFKTSGLALKKNEIRDLIASNHGTARKYTFYYQFLRNVFAVFSRLQYQLNNPRHRAEMTLEELDLNPVALPFFSASERLPRPTIYFTDQEISQLTNGPSIPLYNLAEDGDLDVLPFSENASGFLQYLCSVYSDFLKAEKQPAHEGVCQKIFINFDLSTRRLFFSGYQQLTPRQRDFVLSAARYVTGGALEIERARSNRMGMALETGPRTVLDPTPAATLTANIARLFFKNLSEVPFAALVENANPSDSELANVFSILKHQAHTELLELEGKRAEALKGNAYAKAYFFQSESLVSAVIGDPMTYELSIYPEEVRQKAGGELLAETAKATMKRFGRELGGSLLLGGVCLVIPTKKFKALGLLLTAAARGISLTARAYVQELFCTVLPSMATSGYFLNVAKVERQAAYRRAFASREGGLFLSELKSLGTEDGNLVLSYIDFPLNMVTPMGRVAAGKVAKALGRLSPNARAFAIRLATER
jgi:hypothetical protein